MNRIESRIQQAQRDRATKLDVRLFTSSVPRPLFAKIVLLAMGVNEANKGNAYFR